MGQYTAKTLEAINGLNLAEIVEASGARLKEVKRNWSGKKQYSFVFAHDDMTPLAYGYISGQAVVNLKYLRSSIEHLKGIIFEKRHG